MSTVAFDTLKLAERLQGAGFTRKQAVGASEGLAEALGESYPTKDAVIDAVATLGRSVDRRFTKLEDKVDRLETTLDQHGQMLTDHGQMLAQHGQMLAQHGQMLTDHGQVLAQHGQVLEGIQTMLTKILDGQAVLLQNDMELRRRLDK